MTRFVNLTSFAGTAGQGIATGDANWTVNYQAGSTSAVVSSAARAYQNTGTEIYYSRTETPPGQTQHVEAVIRRLTAVTGCNVGVYARAYGSRSCIVAQLRTETGGTEVRLYKIKGGAATQIGTTQAVSTANDSNYALRLEVSGTSPIEAVVKFDGTTILNETFTDADFNVTGLVGLRFGFGSGLATDSTGLHVASFVAEDSASDTAAPTLTSPTASATGATTASGSVSTNEGNGTLYYLASANASESVATVKAGSSQAVSASGVQNVTVTGLTASTSYYLHFVHTDAAANDSAVSTAAQFTTAAANTSPSFTGPNIADISGTEGVALTPVDVSARFFDSESSLTFSALGTWPAGVTVSSAGVISGTPTTAGTYASLQVRATDAGSLTADSNAFTITVAAPGDAENPTLTGSVTFASITQTTYTAQWPAGSDNVAVTGYEYQIGGTGGAWTDAGNNLSAAITGRTAGTTETVYVRAYDAAGNRSTPAISGEVTLLAAVAGINITEPLKNNTGTLLASLSGVRVAVLQAADLVSVYETSGLTTNASGILGTISDAAITAGQQYHVAIKLADGGVGITGPITAS